jgi:hypothetical protein
VNDENEVISFGFFNRTLDELQQHRATDTRMSAAEDGRARRVDGRRRHLRVIEEDRGRR